jgi:hypothetical protein
MPQIDLASAIIYIRDRGTNFIEVKIGEGNLDYTEAREINFVKSRGELDTAREGEEQELDVRFSFIWEYIKGDGTITVEDALKKRGGAASWVSASLDPDAPYCVNIEVIHVPANGDCDNAIEKPLEHIFLTEFHYERLGHSLKDGAVDCSGKCNSTQATQTREAIEAP